MSTTSIQIEVPNLGPDEIKDAVVAAIVDQTLYTKYFDPEDPDSEGYHLHSRYQSQVAKQVEEVIKEQVRELVPDLVQHILDERVIQYNDYGDRNKDTTMREIVAEEFQNQARQQYRGSGRDQETGFAKLIRETVRTEIAGEIKKVIEEHLEPIRETIQKELGTVTAGALQNALKLHGSVSGKGRG